MNCLLCFTLNRLIAKVLLVLIFICTANAEANSIPNIEKTEVNSQYSGVQDEQV